jgi:hypothetical protein
MSGPHISKAKPQPESLRSAVHPTAAIELQALPRHSLYPKTSPSATVAVTEMDEFDYLAVLISIILGLGITQLLTGVGRWIEQRRVLQAFSPAMIWAGILLLVHVQTWWSMFGLRFVTDWTFVRFAMVLLQPVILYLLATIVLPSERGPVLDLRANYRDQRLWFFGLLAFLLVASVLQRLRRNGRALERSKSCLSHRLFCHGDRRALDGARRRAPCDCDGCCNFNARLCRLAVPRLALTVGLDRLTRDALHTVGPIDSDTSLKAIYRIPFISSSRC